MSCWQSPTLSKERFKIPDHQLRIFFGGVELVHYGQDAFRLRRRLLRAFVRSAARGPDWLACCEAASSAYMGWSLLGRRSLDDGEGPHGRLAHGGGDDCGRAWKRFMPSLDAAVRMRVVWR